MIRTWKFAFACGLGALVASLCPAPAAAQATQPAAPPPAAVQPCRVGFVNMQETMKLFPRYKQLQDQLKAKDEEYLNQVKKKNSRIEELQKEYQITTDSKRKDAIEADIRQIKLEIESIVADAKKTLAKYFDEQVSMIYLQFYGAVADVAKQNSFDIVWRYNEDWNEKEYNQPSKIVQRALSNPIFPMYYDREKQDITYRVVKYLTEKYPTPQAATTNNAAPASGVAQTGATAPAGGSK